MKFGKLQRRLFPQFKRNELADFPIPEKLPSCEARLAALARKATEARFKEPTADIGPIDHEIDELVYALYGLTAAERAIAEAASAE